jgi:aryl-alcohol dehydrogenase-like predicted oxidoreductase
MESLAGKATAEGGRALKERFQRLGVRSDAYARLQDLTVSGIGLGTFLGDNEENTSRQVAEALRLALRSGFNLVDTAINYRDQLSERVVGRVLAELIGKRELTRGEVVVCTKGGYLPLDAGDSSPSREYLSREYLRSGLVPDHELSGGVHCLAPAFLENQLNRSLKNLGLEAVDVYYLHNPETQLADTGRVDFVGRLRRAFEWLEIKSQEGKFHYYGLATWTGLRLDEGEREYLSLEELENLAREVGGTGHRFRVIQAPFNIQMPEIIFKKNQRVGGKPGYTLAQACEHHGLSLVASAPLLQGRLARNLPAVIAEAIPEFREDSQKAVYFARSGAGISSVLVGMSRREHVALNLALMKAQKMPPEVLETILKLS